jgi:hypothetical protein
MEAKMSDLESIKSLILWAKSNKIKKLKVQDVEVEFSDLAFIEDLVAADLGKPKLGEEYDSTKTLVDTVNPSEAKDDDESTLFWSSHS